MAPRKRVKVINHEKKKHKETKKATARDGVTKARKALEDAREKKAQRQTRRDELQKSLAAATGDDAKTLRMEIDSIESELQKYDQDLLAAQAEEEKFKKDEKDADNEDEYSDMEVDDDDPNQPKDSIENKDGIDPNNLLEQLMRGTRLSDPAQITDVTSNAMLRSTQKVACFKRGFGSPAIVLDTEVPKWTIYRIRKDVLIPESCPNLMTWRRAGVVKDPKTEKKWSVDDIHSIQGIAIEVPEGYDKDPEELVKLIPKLSGAEKDKYKKMGKPIPKQPDVQLLIQWKDGMKVQGESDLRFTSWESRTGCRTLWKKHRVADEFLLNVAIKREEGYRKAGGTHSSEIRSMSPIDIPRPGSTPGLDELEEETENEATGNNEEERQTKKKKIKVEETLEEAEKDPQGGTAEKEEKEKKDDTKPIVSKKSAYKDGLKAFESKFRMLEDIEDDAKLTPEQKGEMIQSYDAYLAKAQAN